jgi:hypothetical protein
LSARWVGYQLVGQEHQLLQQQQQGCVALLVQLLKMMSSCWSRSCSYQDARQQKLASSRL